MDALLEMVGSGPALRRTLTGHTDGVTGIAVAPDSTRLASTSRDRAIRIWDIRMGVPQAVMRVDGPLGPCACSPSGRLLAVAGNAGIYLFAVNS